MPKSRKENRAPILVIESNADQWLIIRSALLQCFPEMNPVWINHLTHLQSYLQTSLTDAGTVPALILLEPYLPNRADGLAVLALLKSHLCWQTIPLILLTTDQDQLSINNWYKVGINSYIIKPHSLTKWLNCFYTIRRYWWNLVSLPGHLVIPLWVQAEAGLSSR